MWLNLTQVEIEKKNTVLFIPITIFSLHYGKYKTRMMYSLYCISWELKKNYLQRYNRTVHQCFRIPEKRRYKDTVHHLKKQIRVVIVWRRHKYINSNMFFNWPYPQIFEESGEIIKSLASRFIYNRKHTMMPS